jgi:hypothetical protein
MKFGEEPQEEMSPEKRREMLRSKILANIPPEMLMIDPERFKTANYHKENLEEAEELAALMKEMNYIFFADIGQGDVMADDVERAAENLTEKLDRLKELLGMRVAREQELLATLEDLYPKGQEVSFEFPEKE